MYNSTNTHNGGKQAANLGNPIYEFISKAGNFVQSHYYGEPQMPQGEQWLLAFNFNPEQAMKALFWLRDPRGGAGQRRLFRNILSNSDAQSSLKSWIEANLKNVIEHGRWDDLYSLFDTSVEQSALDLIAEALREKDRLACKWAPRPSQKTSVKHAGVATKIRTHMGLTNKEYRKLIVSGSDVTEAFMSANKWQDIKLEVVPSLCMMRSSKAFQKHIPNKWDDFINSDKTTIKTEVAYPHELVRMLKAGVEEPVIEKAWASMIDRDLVCGHRLLPVIDQSGSMFGTTISGNVDLGDAAATLGMYISEFLPGSLHRRFVTFSERPKVIHWKDDTFSTSLRTVQREDHLNTNIAAVFSTLLDYATALDVPNDQMPEGLIILSDMQFDSAGSQMQHPSKTVIEQSCDAWEAAGYTRPSLVFWNMEGYAGQPVEVYGENAAFISGFSPAILQHLFAAMHTREDGSMFIDYDELVDLALEKYSIVRP